MLNPEEKKALITYRRQRAWEVLNESKEIAKLKFWNLMGNRLYYAVFHMGTALLLDRDLSSKTHSGLIHLLGSQFIAVGLLDKSYGRLISRLYELRQSGDYDDMFDATEQEVMPYFEKVESLLHEMEALISEENK